MIRWIRTGRRVGADGTTVIYTGEGTTLTIESRKRHIQHAGGRPGTWDHTTYWVLNRGTEVIEKYSLADAKAFAETYMKGDQI